MNVNKMRCCNNEKIIQLVEFCKRNKVNAVFVTKPNIKWTIKSCDIIKNKLNGLERSLEVIVADSKAYLAIDSDWLQGGTIAIICRNTLSLIQKEQIKIDELGRQIAIPISNGIKKIIMIVIYRISQSSNIGVYTSIAQYNQMNRKVQSFTY